MKTLYERENLTRGDIILCNGIERIFLTYIEGAASPYICVSILNEDDFKSGKSFNIAILQECDVSAKPKEWYEQIPEEGILCWVSDENEDTKQNVDVIKIKDTFGFHSDTDTWIYAIPVKPEECWQGELR